MERLRRSDFKGAPSKVLAAFALVVLLALLGLPSCSHVQSGVAVRDSVNDYSWAELAAIAGEISSTDDGASAIEIAKRYHLTTSDGKLDGTQGKDVELSGGQRVRAVIAGFNHDERVGGGKAGITFVFEDAVALHEMNNDAGFDDLAESDDVDALGGWPASEMRGWLNGEFESQLPADLQASMADVVKTSVVIPERETEVDDDHALLAPVSSIVGQSVDKLWIPAVVELSGVSAKSSVAQEYPEWSAPLKAEGSQYQLFSDMGVRESKGNPALVRSIVGSDGGGARWWLRSVEDWSFAEVLQDGSIDRRDDAVVGGTPQAVVPCFSL